MRRARIVFLKKRGGEPVQPKALSAPFPLSVTGDMAGFAVRVTLVSTDKRFLISNTEAVASTLPVASFIAWGRRVRSPWLEHRRHIHEPAAAAHAG